MIKKWLRTLIGRKAHPDLYDWRTGHSILNFLRSRCDVNGNLTEEAYDLPDENKDTGKIRFAPGLKDAMSGPDDSETAKTTVQQLSKLLKSIATDGDPFSEQEFYRMATKTEGIAGIMDDLLKTVVNDSLPVNPHLSRFARDLTTKTGNRNAVKPGIALLGLCGDKSVLKDIKLLGLHNEFTVFAAMAITNLSDNPVNDLWELAKKVNGWGKIQLVERLAQPGLEEPIKEWLIYDGYKNNVMHEYLALTCAINGELHKRLEAEQIDLKLFKSASDILEALIADCDRPANISNYPYAGPAIKNFLRHAGYIAGDIADFNFIYKLRDFLNELQNNMDGDGTNGWDQDLISGCLTDIAALLNSKDWKSLAGEGLKSKDSFIYWSAKQAAEKLGMDLWETVWQRLGENPLDNFSWYDVTHYGKAENADQIIDFALKTLPFDELSTGPADLMGAGPQYKKFLCLDHAITFLENYPMKGEKIILAGLRCPVTRNRNMAIRVLHKWTKENWSAEIDRAVNLLRSAEPNQYTKDNIDRLINGQDLK